MCHIQEHRLKLTEGDGLTLHECMHSSRETHKALLGTCNILVLKILSDNRLRSLALYHSLAIPKMASNRWLLALRLLGVLKPPQIILEMLCRDLGIKLWR